VDPNAIREFALAGKSGDGRRPYLNADGAFIGLGTPILERDGTGRWKPRDSTELGWLFKSGYGNAIDKLRIERGLARVASALNNGDLSLASIALVHCEIPPLRGFDDASRLAKTDALLTKSNPNWADEPRIPASETGAGEWTDGGSEGASSVVNEPSPDYAITSPSPLLTDIAYQGVYHDQVVVTLAALFLNKGAVVQTNMPLTSADGSTTSVADLLVKDPQTNQLYVVEVKTGDDPRYTAKQLLVYPMAGAGFSIYSNSPRIAALGFAPGELLPPAIVDLVYALPDHQYFWFRLFPPEE